MKLSDPHEQDVRDFYAYLIQHAQGRAQAITARDLGAALALGPNGDRALRALVHAANELGLLVVADNAGYFVPTSPAEVEEAIGRLRSQATEMLERARRIESLALKTFSPEQMSLWQVADRL